MFVSKSKYDKLQKRVEELWTRLAALEHKVHYELMQSIDKALRS